MVKGCEQSHIMHKSTSPVFPHWGLCNLHLIDSPDSPQSATPTDLFVTSMALWSLFSLTFMALERHIQYFHHQNLISLRFTGLEGMYQEILRLLGVDKEYLPGSRRSISSASSISQVTGGSRRRLRSAGHRHHRSREIKWVHELAY